MPGFWLGVALAARATASLYVSDDDPASLAERALRLAQKREQPFEIGCSLLTLGCIATTLGDYESSRDFYERAAALASEHGFASLEANGLSNLASIALEQERYADAEALTARALDSEFDGTAYGGKAVACRVFAEALAGRRANRQAAILIAAADRELARSGGFQDPSERVLRAAALERIDVAIGPAELARALAAGADLPISEAIKLALSIAE